MPEPETPPPPSEVAAEIKPLADQFVEEFQAICSRDPRLRALRRSAENTRDRLSEANNNIRYRERQLRRKAADILRKKHGIKIIPGYNDEETSMKGALSRMPKRVTALLKELTAALPSGSLPPEIQTLIDQANAKN